MANPNPDAAKARMGKKAKRRSQPGTVEAARALLWQALERAAELLQEDDPYLSLKAVHAVSQGASAYAKIVEVGELEARIEALEAQGTGPTLGRGAA